MALWQIIIGIITGLISLLLGVYVSFTARQKGPVFLNTHIYVRGETDKIIDKKAEYHLVTVVFSCLTVFSALETVYIASLNLNFILRKKRDFCKMKYYAIYSQ